MGAKGEGHSVQRVHRHVNPDPTQRVSLNCIQCNSACVLPGVPAAFRLAEDTLVGEGQVERNGISSTKHGGPHAANQVSGKPWATIDTSATIGAGPPNPTPEARID